ncbi:MAG: hypothetical protein KDD37_08605 [Bdellovibrionales bacterium]|nr:hypothetical protein [Bdellovibrionales bacterium]
MLFLLVLSQLFALPAGKGRYCSVSFTDPVNIIDSRWVSKGSPLSEIQVQLLESKGIDPTGVTYLGGGSEGSVFLLADRKEAVKIFNDSWNINNTLKASGAIDKHLIASGFRVPETYKINKSKLLMFFEYVPGITLDAYFSMPQLTNRQKNRVFRNLRAMFKSLRLRVARDKSILKVAVNNNHNRLIDYQGVYESIPSYHADFKLSERDRSVVNIHAENIIVQISDTGAIEFVVIDYL